MKKLRLMIAVLVGSALLFSGCSKVDSNNLDTASLNYDAAYVVNGESNSISIINLSTNLVEKTIDLSQLESRSGSNQMGMGMSNLWAHHISLSPDKSKLVIAAPGMDFSGGHNMMQASATSGSTTDEHSQHHGGSSTGNSISETPMPSRILILDAVTGELLKELTLEGMVHNAIFSSDSKELWTAIMMPKGKINVFDATTYTLISTIEVGQMPAEVTFSDDGKKVFVANGMSNTVTVIDAFTKKVIETIKVGNNPVGAWPGMDGMMYVDNEGGQSISMVNSMTNMMTDTLNLGFTPGMAVRNSMMNQMWVSDPDGSKIHMWTKNSTGYVHGGEVAVGNGAHAIAFNKEGNISYVTNQTEGTVSVVDVPNLKEIIKITVGKKPNGIVIRYKSNL